MSLLAKHLYIFHGEIKIHSTHTAYVPDPFMNPNSLYEACHNAHRISSPKAVFCFVSQLEKMLVLIPLHSVRYVQTKGYLQVLRNFINNSSLYICSSCSPVKSILNTGLAHNRYQYMNIHIYLHITSFKRFHSRHTLFELTSFHWIAG